MYADHKELTQGELEKLLLGEVKKGMTMVQILPSDESFDYLCAARKRYSEYIIDKETNNEFVSAYNVQEIYFWEFR